MHRNWLVCIPFVFVPAVAWGRDVAVVVAAALIITMIASRSVPWRATLSAASNAPWLWTAGAFMVWLTASMTWAPYVPMGTWSKTLLALMIGMLLVVGASKIPNNRLNAIELPIIISIVALLALLAFERLTDGALIRIDRTEDTSVQILNTLSGGLVFLSCLSFPVAWMIYKRWKTSLWPLVFMAAALALSFVYRMDAVPVGLFIAMLSSMAVLRFGKYAFISVVTAMGLLTLSWAPLSVLASDLALDTWLIDHVDRNWGFRLIIWAYVGDAITQHWFIGYGFDSSRVLGAAADLLPERSGTSTFLHPHNGLLQIWLELGLVGVALLATMVVLLTRRILAATPSNSALAATTGALIFYVVIWSLSYGVWQGWWLAVLGLTGATCVAALRINRETANT